MSEQAGKKLVRLLPLPTIKDLMQLYKVKAVRKLSQNFLLDENLNHKIVKSAGQIKKADVCEVGPGPGNITRCIIHKGAEKIILVEKDQQFLPTLQMLRDASPTPIDIIHGDILRYNLEGKFSENKRKAWEDDCPNIHIIGNLPFNIATPLIVRWLRDISEKKNAWTYGRVPMTLTFQKEVAERMIAPVMTAQRCRLSVMCQNWCTIEYKFTISGRSFLPKPKVDVGVVHLIPHKIPIIPLPFDLVEKVVKSLFSSRQKYCVKTLSFLFPRAQAHLAEEILKVAEIEPFSRPLQLSVEEIGKLCHLYKDIIEQNPSLKHYDHKKKDDYWLTREEDELHKISEWQNRQIQNNFY